MEKNKAGEETGSTSAGSWWWERHNENKLVREGTTEKVISKQDLKRPGSEPRQHLGEKSTGVGSTCRGEGLILWQEHAWSIQGTGRRPVWQVEY